ncbi:MAG: DUF5658 family protein [Thermacetogeniaceae bacterium]
MEDYHVQRKIFGRLLAAIIILNIVDLIITMYPISGYGPLKEANTILLWLHSISPVLLIAYKVAMGFIFAAGLWLFARLDFKATYWCAVAVVVAFCLITAWNIWMFIV